MTSKKAFTEDQLAVVCDMVFRVAGSAENAQRVVDALRNRPEGPPPMGQSPCDTQGVQLPDPGEVLEKAGHLDGGNLQGIVAAKRALGRLSVERGAYWRRGNFTNPEATVALDFAIAERFPEILDRAHAYLRAMLDREVKRVRESADVALLEYGGEGDSVR